MSGQRPLPLPDAETAPYWEAASDGRLLIQRCDSCGAFQFYPRVLCASCGDGPPAWHEASGRGTVHTFTVIRQNLVPPFSELAPYVLAIVDLEEGVRMMGNVLGCDPDDVSIGMPVEVCFEAASDEISLPMWRPVGTEERTPMPKVVDPEAQRDEVLDATLRTITRLGIAGTTMREIADEGNISTGFITHYFPDKNAVLLATLRRANARSEERMQEHLGDLRGLAAVGAVVEATLPLTEEGRLGWVVWLSFWGSTLGNADLGHEQRAGYRAWKGLIVHHLRGAQDAGEIGADRDVEYEADRLIALIVGIGVQSALLGVRRQAKQAQAFIDDHLAELGAERG